MAHDLRRELLERNKLRLRLNRAVVVPTLPVSDRAERKDAAIRAWFADIFRLYNIDPVSSTRWEQMAWSLAFDLFPSFKIIGSPNIGNPGTHEGVMQLFYKFQKYKAPAGGGSKYKLFLRDHKADCYACKIRSDGALKGAMLRARRQHDQDRHNVDLLIRHEAMKALGLFKG